LINTTFVINAVAHAYNLSDSNIQLNKYADSLRDILVGLHRDWQPEIGLDEAAQRTDWPVEVLARTLFLESDVDMAATHTLRLDSYFKDGLCARRKTVEAVRRWPQRFLGYVGVDPTLGLQTCLRDLDDQLDELPEAVGLKLYPAQVNPIRSFRMDDPELAFPLFERAQERGIKSVAVHKASPLGAVPLNPFRVDDIDSAADRFPELSFEIVHAGLAFAEETALAIGRYPNVYANLEITSALITKSRGMFEQIMAQLLFWGGSSKVIFGDGSMVFHSSSIVEAFADFTFSDETLQTYGIPQLTAEDRALILGGNFARIHGIDIEAAKVRIAEDEFSAEKARTGRQAPYSNWKAALESIA
jgi:predicted TIM-barrel fold metal-dependent hydrolase